MNQTANDRAKAWNAAHRDRVKANRAAYKAANGEYLRQYAARYAAAHRDKNRDRVRAWRARMKWYGFWQGSGLTQDEVKAAWVRDYAWRLKRPAMVMLGGRAVFVERYVGSRIAGYDSSLGDLG